MANKQECLSCENLHRDIKQINVKRSDGRYETACAYSCVALHLPLPTLSNYDAPGCRWYDKKAGLR